MGMKHETAAKFEAEVGQVLDSGHCWNLLFVCVWKIFQAVGCQLFFFKSLVPQEKCRHRSMKAKATCKSKNPPADVPKVLSSVVQQHLICPNLLLPFGRS